MNSVQNYQFIEKLKSLPFVEEIWLFGSRARGDNDERSDIDLAIICSSASPAEWSQVNAIIENADTLLKIDCVRFDVLEAGEKIKENIEKFKQVLYKKERGQRMDVVFWKDSFASLGNAIVRLAEIIRHPDLEKNDYMRDAVIQRFEFVLELFWKVLKKILAYEKIDSASPRDVVNKAFQYKLISDEALWLQMFDDRNNTSHAYREAVAKLVLNNIKHYLPIFEITYEKIKIQYANQL